MLKELFNRYPQLIPMEEHLRAAVKLLEDTVRGGGKILLCGNGGSCADCDHIVGELMKGFLSARPLSASEASRFKGLCEHPDAFAKALQGAIPAISLPSQGALLSAYANDVDPASVYAQLTWGYGRSGDLLIALSTSGNSENIVRAVIAARARGMKTLALTGSAESKLSALCDLTLRAPASLTYQIQELHLPIYHYLCAALEARIFSKGEDTV